MKCPYCAFVTALPKDPDRRVDEQDYEDRIRWLASIRSGSTKTTVEGLSEVRCDGCGANVAFHGTLTSTDCAFCGAPVQRDKVHDATDRVPVDGVFPFQVEQSRAKQVLREWVASRWFAPGEFTRRGVDGRFAGVYVPYWTFDAFTVNRYTGERGEHYYVTRRVGNNTVTERRTRWYPAAGTFDLPFDDVLVVAAKNLPTELLDKLEPWPLKKCAPFDPQLMAGFLAQTYDVELPDGFRDAKGRMDAGIDAETRRQIGGDDQRVHSLQSVYDAITYKHLLLPVWLLSYKYGDTTYRVVVNAVTGEVQGTRPWSAWKITGFVLLCLAVLGAIVLLANK
ncbi:MAG: hypothetical protein K8T90_00010 [Planctomycetes bacterium]|nr:hypothetical protein [Planctomycetota bacterium]